MDKIFINVYGLPNLVQPELLSGQIAVVIDVLRATTTMITALKNGVKCVCPQLEVEETKQLKTRILNGLDPRFPKNISSEDILLGGERHGKKIEGFDLGNSPREYTIERVADKFLLFSTTNGTKALHQAKPAKSIYLASFLNAKATVDKIITTILDDAKYNEQPSVNQINIICAGTDGKFTEEDMCLAGLLVERVQRLGESENLAFSLNAQAISVKEMWKTLFSPPKIIGQQPILPEALAQHLKNSRGGQNLLKIGLGDDILTASKLDSIDMVVTLDADFNVVSDKSE
ncbi:MAG: 2-phosphosulfolactate phosphatase [Thermoguttaceae bacterium]